MSRLCLTTLWVVACAAQPAVATAQSTPGDTPGAWFVGGGAGFGWGTLAVGANPEVGSEFGAILFGQAGTSRSGRRRWMVETEIQLFDVPSPTTDERFRAFRALVRRSFNAPFYATPGVGIEYRRWAGDERLEDADTGLVLALGFGRHVPLGGSVVLHPEISWSYSFVERAGTVSGAGVSVRVGAIRLLR